MTSCYLGAFARYRIYRGDGKLGAETFDFSLQDQTIGLNAGRRWIWNNGINLNITFGYGYSDALEQVLRTLVGMKVYINIDSQKGRQVNELMEKRMAVRSAAVLLTLFNTPARIFDLPCTGKAIGHVTRETGHTRNNAKVIGNLIRLIDKLRVYIFPWRSKGLHYEEVFLMGTYGLLQRSWHFFM